MLKHEKQLEYRYKNIESILILVAPKFIRFWIRVELLVEACKLLKRILSLHSSTNVKVAGMFRPVHVSVKQSS